MLSLQSAGKRLWHVNQLPLLNYYTWSLCVKLAVRTRKNFSNSPVVNDQLMGDSHTHLAPQCSLSGRSCTWLYKYNLVEVSIWSFFFFFLSFFFLSTNDNNDIDNTNVKHSRSGSLSPELLFPWRAAAWPRRRAGVLCCLLSTLPAKDKQINDATVGSLP